MPGDPDGGDVEVEIPIAAPPVAVFPFLTDPARLLRWMGVSALLEPVPGGLFRIDLNGRDVARGQFVEIVPPRRVVFTWGWEGSAHGVPPGATTVEIDLLPDGEGTRLRLRHKGLRGDNRGRHEEGWRHYTGRLKIAAEGGDPGRDPLSSPAVSHG